MEFLNNLMLLHKDFGLELDISNLEIGSEIVVLCVGLRDHDYFMWLVWLQRIR